MGLRKVLKHELAQAVGQPVAIHVQDVATVGAHIEHSFPIDRRRSAAARYADANEMDPAPALLNET